MKTWIHLSMALAVGLMLWSGSALAGQGKPAECGPQGKINTPEKVEGQVVKIDPDQGKVTLRGNGTTYEFHASRETLQDLKVGDRIEAKLREAPKCPQ